MRQVARRAGDGPARTALDQYETVLADQFPTVEFTTRVSQKLHLYVEWTDGPTEQAARALAPDEIITIVGRIPSALALATCAVVDWLTGETAALQSTGETTENFDYEGVDPDVVSYSAFVLEAGGPGIRFNALANTSVRRAYLHSLRNTADTLGPALAQAAGVDLARLRSLV